MTHSNHYYFTSESVSEGHPDKICDRISDEILDYCLNKDAQARCAVEVLATTNHVTIAGEVRGNGITDTADEILPNVKDDMCNLVRKAVKDIGYEQDGFHWEKLDINFLLHGQSPDIAGGVDKDDGAGDQGLMFGYATNQLSDLGISPNDHKYMPGAIYFSHKILQKLSDLQKKDDLFRPDMKSQVTLIYDNSHKIIGVDNIVVSTQHTKKYFNDDKELLDPDTWYADIRCKIENIVTDIFADISTPLKSSDADGNLVAFKVAEFVTDTKKLLINPAGNFNIGGPDGDAGLTGRKIIVDTYGGACPHGGGAFSGKDPTKVDRSAAYMARYLAKNIVAAKLADACQIQLAYAIGDPEPKSVFVDTYGTSEHSNAELIQIIDTSMLSPLGIRTHLDLNRPIYVPTSSYGHFGRKVENGLFPWEALTLVNDLKQNI